jgi:hypothetical protein
MADSFVSKMTAIKIYKHVSLANWGYEFHMNIINVVANNNTFGDTGIPLDCFDYMEHEKICYDYSVFV